jgi:putative ABC transport system permease protein
MKAVGGRRRQIAAVYLKTAMLLGGLGTVAGIVLGVVLAYVLTRYFGSTFFAVRIGFGIDWAIVLASALVGLLGPPLARPAQIGLGNVGRRRRRSLSTALVIALAVGTLLAVLGLRRDQQHQPRLVGGLRRGCQYHRGE